jgi:hypothetical protein
MHRKSTFEETDANFVAHAESIVKECTEHSVEWSIDAARLSEITNLTAEAKSAYDANKDIATRNLISSTHKKTAFDNLKHALSMFVNYIEGTPSVPDEALVIMGLRPRSHHAYEPVKRPDEAPVMKVVKQRFEMTVYVARAELGHPTESATGKHYHGFKLRWRFENETTYHNEVSTSLHFTLRFDEADETKRIILSAAWVNPRLEEGPWCEHLTEVIG